MLTAESDCDLTGKTKLLKASKKVQNKELFAKVIAETSSKWTTNHSLR